MRVFIALPLPPQTACELEPLLMSLRKCFPVLTTVKSSSLHFTLFFLGERTPLEVQRLSQSLKDFPLNTEVIKASFEERLRSFPAKGQLRVIWCELKEGEEAITRLYLDLRQLLNEAKISLLDEVRVFKPHLTLARNKGLFGDRTALQNFRVTTKEFYLERIVLFKSILKPTGAEYLPLAERLL